MDDVMVPIHSAEARSGLARILDEDELSSYDELPLDGDPRPDWDESQFFRPRR